jgi:hypothetical protein
MSLTSTANNNPKEPNPSYLNASKLLLKNPNPFNKFLQVTCAAVLRVFNDKNTPTKDLTTNICKLFKQIYNEYSQKFTDPYALSKALKDNDFSILTVSLIPTKLVRNILELLPNELANKIFNILADNLLEGVIAWRNKKWGNVTYLFALVAKPDSLLKLGKLLIEKACEQANNKDKQILASAVLGRGYGLQLLLSSGFFPVGLSFNLTPELYNEGRQTVVQLVSDSYNTRPEIYIPDDQPLRDIIEKIANNLSIQLSFSPKQNGQIFAVKSPTDKLPDTNLTDLLKNEEKEFGISELVIPSNCSEDDLNNLLKEIDQLLDNGTLQHISLIVEAFKPEGERIINQLLQKGFLFERLIPTKEGIYIGMQKIQNLNNLTNQALPNLNNANDDLNNLISAYAEYFDSLQSENLTSPAVACT